MCFYFMDIDKCDYGKSYTRLHRENHFQIFFDLTQSIKYSFGNFRESVDVLQPINAGILLITFANSFSRFLNLKKKAPAILIRNKLCILCHVLMAMQITFFVVFFVTLANWENMTKTLILLLLSIAIHALKIPFVLLNIVIKERPGGSFVRCCIFSLLGKATGGIDCNIRWETSCHYPCRMNQNMKQNYLLN